MPPATHLPRNSGRDDSYFDPTGASSIGYPLADQHIKQDLPSDDGYQESNEEANRKSWIGAYRGSNKDGLPAEKGFLIQVGSECFRLSGASIMSDAPSYFSKFFEEQIRNPENVGGSVRTLYIDRDPETFKDIARHLQGYYIYAKDGEHLMRLFADAQFYSLPRLNKQLFESEIYVQIGETDFRLPKDIFSSPGDMPNFFTLACSVFLSTPSEMYPGLDRNDLIRPPPVEAPRISGRSPAVFADLLHVLRGYPLNIRSAEHRAELLRDCRYYNLKGLEQKLIFHDISYNHERETNEIVLKIEDLRQSGISIRLDDMRTIHSGTSIRQANVRYARPFVDDNGADLIIEIGDSTACLKLAKGTASFHSPMKSRVASLLQVLGNKVAAIDAKFSKLSTDTDAVQFRLSPETHILLDGEDFDLATSELSAIPDLFWGPILKKRKLSTTGLADGDEEEEWIVKRGQWRIRIEVGSGATGRRDLPELILEAVKIDAVCGQRGRNRARGFLAG